MDITLVEETVKDRTGAATHLIRVCAGRNRDGKVLYEAKGKRYLDVIKKTLQWCQSKFAHIYKIYFADGNIWTNEFQHSIIMDTVFDCYESKSDFIQNKPAENNN